jgi:hypothetical protein
VDRYVPKLNSPNKYQVSFKYIKWFGTLGKPHLDGKIIVKGLLKKCEIGVWTGFIWFGTETSAVVKTATNLCSP